jgi:hypothetical protein
MTKYALIKDNKVINKVVEIPSPLPDNVTLLETTGSAHNIKIGDYWDSDNNLIIENTIISLLNFTTASNSVENHKIYGTGSNDFILQYNNSISGLSVSNLSSKTLDISNFESSPLSSSFNLTIKPEYSSSTEEISIDLKIDLEGIVDNNSNPVSYPNFPLYFTGSIE